MRVIFCKHCGNMIESSGLFCPKCGKAVERASESVRHGMVYDSASFAIAKEFIEAVRSAKGLSTAGLILMLAIIPASLLLLIPVARLIPVGMGIASCICAAISTSRLSVTKRLPLIGPESIDPVSYATYFKSVKDAKTSKTMNTAVYIMAALAIVAFVGFIVLVAILGEALIDYAGGFSGPAYSF